MEEKVLIRLRMGSNDAHYGGNLVDGAKMLQLFGDVATELLIRLDGDEAYSKPTTTSNLWLRYMPANLSKPKALSPTLVNLRAKCRSRRKVVVPRPDISASAADFLETPVVVCRATGTCVTPVNNQRKNKQ